MSDSSTMKVRVKRPAKRADTASAQRHEVLTASEAAALLRVSKPCVYAMANKQQGFPARMVGNKLRFSRSALMAWLQRTV